jgi:phage anti-repressor protein
LIYVFRARVRQRHENIKKEAAKDMTDDLKVVQPGIVPVYEDGDGRTLVNARELHSFLGSRQEFAHWIKGRIEKYGFFSDEDYLIILSNRVGGGIGKPKADYLLTLNTAKEIALVENNEMGRLIRKYFIACEKKLRAFCGAANDKESEKLRQ